MPPSDEHPAEERAPAAVASASHEPASQAASASQAAGERPAGDPARQQAGEAPAAGAPSSAAQSGFPAGQQQAGHPSPQASQPSPQAGRPAAAAGQARAAAAGRLPPAEPAVQQRATAALFLALLSLFGLMGINDLAHGVYVVGFALLAGLIAVWFAATAMARTRRRGTARPRGSVTATVIAGIGVAISAVLLAGFAVLGQQLSTYQQCMSGANTITARQDCQHQFSSAVNKEISGLRAITGQ
jgi:hypothetical protein